MRNKYVGSPKKRLCTAHRGRGTRGNNGRQTLGAFQQSERARGAKEGALGATLRHLTKEGTSTCEQTLEAVGVDRSYTSARMSVQLGAKQPWNKPDPNKEHEHHLDGKQNSAGKAWAVKHQVPWPSFVASVHAAHMKR
jgi:hypothetical protein